MTTQLTSDVLQLLDEPSDIEMLMSDSVPEDNPGVSGPSSGGNPSVGKARQKGKRPAKSDSVSRKEFASMQDQMTALTDLIQTLQSSVMDSLDHTPRKKQITDHIVSSSSGESANQLADALLQSNADDNSSIGIFNTVEQFYSEEDLGDQVNEKLADIVSKLLRKKSSEEKITQKLNSFKRPSNVPDLQGTKVNPEIWKSLRPKTRSMDIKLQRVEHATLKGMVPVVTCINSLMSSSAMPKEQVVLKQTLGCSGHIGTFRHGIKSATQRTNQTRS